MNKNQKIIIGNWKMFKDVNETKTFLNEFNELLKNNQVNENIKFGISANFLSLETIKNHKLDNMLVGAQNLSQHKEGAYTGEVSAQMIKSQQMDFVLIGHSERRQYFHETDQIINEKVKLALENNLIPVVCVGETIDQYENKESEKVITEQVTKALMDVNNLENIIIAYEPVWAIGTGKVPTVDYVENICQLIYELTNNQLLVQYGGSVNPQNIAQFLKSDFVNGALVGGASLKPESFLELITYNQG